jgi:Heterokaryon incompatibility protein (HET)
MESPEDTVIAVHRPLDKDALEIRLVFIEPATERLMPVACRLEVVKLLDQPYYEALSWCWGDPKDKEEILLEGHRWSVRKNLATALRYLRYEDRTRVMWIDALSINQKTSPDALREREHQIQLMRRVYSIAHQVVIWMGILDEDTAAFIKTYMTGQKSLIYGLLTDNMLAIRSIITVQRFPWWRRLWILQEVALASNVWVQFGPLRIPFHRLISEFASVHEVLQRFFERHSDSTTFQLIRMSTSSTYAPSPYTFFDLRKSCIDLANQLQTRPSSRAAPDNTDSSASKSHAFKQFAGYIVRFRHHAASEPLDKLYGLLGLVPDFIGQDLEPNYDEDVIRMYRRTTAQIIRSSKSLYVLSQAQIELVTAPYASMLPSWVPDWAAELPVDYDWDHAVFREHRERLFNASSGTSFEIQTHDDNRTLVLQGVMIDIITGSCDLGLRTKDFQQWWQSSGECRKLAGVYGFQKSAGEIYIDGSPRNCAYWRTLVNNTISYTGSLDTLNRSYSDSYEYSTSQLEEESGRHQLEYIDDALLSISLNAAQAEEQGDTATFDTGQIFAHIMRVLYDKVLFVTSHRLMGTGTKELRYGDQVWVLAGGTHAFIIREDDSTPGHHKLVGEAYVEGIMMSGDLSKPYVSQLVRRRRQMGDEDVHMNHDAVMWEEVLLR